MRFEKCGRAHKYYVIHQLSVLKIVFCFRFQLKVNLKFILPKDVC
jgi:hypothetical protein